MKRVICKSIDCDRCQHVNVPEDVDRLYCILDQRIGASNCWLHQNLITYSKMTVEQNISNHLEFVNV